MTILSYQLAQGQTRWFYIVDLPPGPDGKRRQKKKRGYLTQEAALKGERELLAAFGTAELAANGTLTAELDAWLAERELDLEATSLANYRDVVRCYIAPHIGRYQLYAVDKQLINGLYKTLLRCGDRRGGPLSAGTVRIVHRVLMKALKDIGITVDGVRQPRPEARETMGRKGVWTPAQSKQFLTFHGGHRMRAAWALAIVVGARRGEIAGLKWSRIDLDRGVLYLRWQRTTTSTGVVEKAPKGKVYHDRDYVFCKENGEPYYPRYFTDDWEKACAAAGVPVVALHDARHTSATTGADAGVPEHVMQRRLGHADARTTREVYTHVLPESERRAAELMEAVLS